MCCLLPNLATSLAFYLSEKEFLGPLGPGVEKAQKVEKELKTSRKPEKNLKNSHFRLFFEFFDPGAERPRESLFRLFFGVF